MPSDAELVLQTIQGDYEAFSKLVARYQGKIYALLLPIVRLPEDAEDLAQDTFVQAYCCLKQLRDPAKFSAWLCQIARNLGRQHIAHKQKLDAVPLENAAEKLSAAPSAEEVLLRKEQIATIRRAIDSLPPLDRRLLESFYFDGKSYKELSQIHGLSFRAIANRLYKARRFIIGKIKRISQAIAFLFASAVGRKAIAKGVSIMSISLKTKTKAIVVVAIIGALVVGIKFGAKVMSPSMPKHSEVTNVSASKDTSYRRAYSPTLQVRRATTYSNPSISADIPDDYETPSLSEEVENIEMQEEETEMEQFNSPMPEETSEYTDDMRNNEEQEEEITKEIQFDSGYLSSAFITDEERMEAVLEEPYILIYDGQISDWKNMIPLLEHFAYGSPLLVIAEGLPGDSLKVLEVNKVRNVLKVAAVRAPGYGYEQKNNLRDIAMRTGGMVISEDMDLKHVTPSDLGIAQRAIIDNEHTTIVPFQ